MPETKTNVGMEYYDCAARTVRSFDPRHLDRVKWRAIASFLESIEPERSAEGFANRALEELESVIEFDRAFFIETDARDLKKARLYKYRESSEARFKTYVDYYRFLDPVLRTLPQFGTVFVDWTRYPEDEFSRDFISYTGSSHGLGLSNLHLRSDSAFVLIISRSGMRDFTETEKLTVAALFPHLHNLSSSLRAPLGFRARQFAEIFKEACLTRREEEVALHLSEGLAVSEIAELLFVSRKTVAKHLEHVYTKLGVRGKRQARDRLLNGELPRGAGNAWASGLIPIKERLG